MPTTSPPPTEPFIEALLASPLAVAVIDRELRYSKVNAAVLRLIERDPLTMIGQPVRVAVPQLADQLEPALRHVLEHGTPIHDLELRSDSAGRVWKARVLPLRDASGDVTGAVLTAEEIMSQQEVQVFTPEPGERAVFQLRLSDALRSLSDPLEVQRVAARLLQGRLGADRVFYAEIESDSEYATIAFDEGKLEPNIVGRHRLADFGPALLSEIRAGRTLMIENAATDARLADHERTAHGALGVSATLAYPLFKAEQPVAMLVAHSGSSRAWTYAEALLLADTAERTWEALERARSAAALEASNARQGFLLHLSDALRGLDSAEEIQYIAARLLSERIGASRAGYAQDTGDGENVEITSDYSAPDAPSLRGRYRYENYGDVLLLEFRAGRAVVRPDIANDPSLSTQERDAHAQIGIGASLNVPMLKNGRLTAIFFVHHAHAHPWTPEEVTLAAQTAERTWEAAQRARAEAELRASYDQFARTLEDAPVPMLVQAEDGEVLRVNRAWTALTGYTHSDLPTMDAWLTHAYGHGSEALRDRMRALFAGEIGIVDAEFGIVTKAGERRTWLLSASSPGHMQDGRRFAVAMATDITERRAALREISEGKLLLETLLDQLPVGVFLTDPNGQSLMMNAALNAMWRGKRDLRDPSDYRAYRAWDEQGKLLEPEDWPVFKALNTAQAQGSVELRFERFDGTRGTMQTSAVPLLEADGRVARVVAVAIDVTEQREAEGRVRENDARLRLALDGNRMVTWQLSVRTNEVTVSDNFATVYGVSALANGADSVALIWPEDLGAHRARFDEVVREGGTYCSEFRITRPIDGRVVWIEERATALRDADGQVAYLVGVANDITERKTTQERLQRNAETFASLVQGAPFGIYIVDADFCIAQVSVGALPTFEGVSPLIGRDLEEVLRLIWAEPFASDAISKFRHTLKTGEPYTAATTAQREDRGGVESYDWRIERVTLPDGRLGVVCYFHDVTIPRATTERLEQVNAAQRRFVSDAAHELRAPLTAIRGNLSLLRRYADIAVEERTAMLGDAERETNRLTRLITDLLTVARGQMRDEVEPERVKLDALLEESWRGALSLSDHRRFELGVLEPLVVMGNPDELKQLFLILLENAVKYSPIDGTVRFEASERESWAEVRVYNDGAGIAADDLERVFERFYRTDRARSRSSEATGTGLGLTIARQIVERHGGRVWLESAEGQGTTAIVRLPRPPNE